MPSPFPGMDPYLENPALWPDVHARLIGIIAEKLLERLRPDYFVQIEERIFVTNWDDPGERVYVPDLSVLAVTSFPRESSRDSALAIDDAIELAEFTAAERKERYLAIRDRHSHEIVTVIEVLSPANKVPGSQALSSYLQKRRDVLDAGANFVEIDLLRGGERVAWLAGIACDYLAHVSTVAGKPQGRLWPMKLTERLKVIGIPLRAGESLVPLDLQDVLATANDRAGYDLIIDYSQPPVPPLAAVQEAWAAEVLKAARSAPRLSSSAD